MARSGMLSGIVGISASLMGVGLNLILNLGCSSSSSAPAPRVVDKPTCDTKPDVGTAAIASNAFQTEWVNSDFFQKPYDRYDLEAVLNASSNTTSSYVISLGINTNRIPSGTSTNICPTYYTLPVANSNFLKVWSDESSKSGGDGTLAGLFFEYCGDGGQPCRDRLMVNPTILVAENGDRWTLVHEMMHYNFNQGRKADLTNPSTSELNRATGLFEQNYKLYYKDFLRLPNRDDLTSTVKNLRGLIETGREALVRRALEEMSIEGMLMNLWAENRFVNVSNDSAYSAVWYMNYSRDVFLGSMNRFPGMIATLRTNAEENFWPEITTELDNLTLLLETYQRETSGLIDTAKVKFKKKTGRDWTPPSAQLTPLGYFSVVTPEVAAEFNAVSFDSKLRAHFASHDEGDLQKSFDDAVNDIAEFTKNASN